ncbi:MAG: hypothetical protein CO035_03630, partial [Candidatus Omnitrophica bacterium CG_4_9_14_0_2_um_filter_42_8]
MFKNAIYGKVFIIFLLTSVFCGCAALTVKRDESKNTMVYPYPCDKLWDNLIEVITEHGDTVVVKDNEKGIIFTGYDEISVEELKRIAKMPPLSISSGLAGAWLYARKKTDYSIKAISSSETQVKMISYLQGYNASGQRWVNIFTNGVK